MIWNVARRGGAIVAAFSYQQPGYADEQLDDTNSTELQAYLQNATLIPDSSNSGNLPKVLRAILLTAGQMAGKTPAQTAATFTAVWQAMP